MLTKTAITLYCPLNDHDLRCVKNAEIDDRIVLSKVQAIINAGKHFEKFELNLRRFNVYFQLVIKIRGKHLFHRTSSVPIEIHPTSSYLLVM